MARPFLAFNIAHNSARQLAIVIGRFRNTESAVTISLEKATIYLPILPIPFPNRNAADRFSVADPSPASAWTRRESFLRVARFSGRSTSPALADQRDGDFSLMWFPWPAFLVPAPARNPPNRTSRWANYPATITRASSASSVRIASSSVEAHWTSVAIMIETA